MSPITATSLARHELHATPSPADGESRCYCWQVTLYCQRADAERLLMWQIGRPLLRDCQNRKPVASGVQASSSRHQGSTTWTMVTWHTVSIGRSVSSTKSQMVFPDCKAVST